MTIAANKIKGIRCGLCHDYYTALMARQHTDCNVVAMGERVIGDEVAKQIVKAFLETSFLSDNANHPRRVKMLNEMI